MKVTYFHRKPWQGNHSIEIIFQQIRNTLPQSIQVKIKVLDFFSQGIIKRIASMVMASFYQQEVNHITGDVHFIALFLNRRKTILTIHDIGLMSHKNVWVRTFFKWFWIVLPIKRSAVVTTVSNQTKNELLRYVKTKPDKIKVVYNPVSSIFYPSQKIFNKIEPVILQIGTKENKNLYRLIEAIRGISCRLDIVGKVNDKLLKSLVDANIKFSVSVNISDAEMFERYKGADIVSFVSTYEGFGMPIIEANAIGRVVVSSNVSSMPEIAGAGAHLVDPFDVKSIREGILKVIHDDSYRELLIERGFENKKRFELQEVTKQYVNIYSFICGY